MLLKRDEFTDDERETIVNCFEKFVGKGQSVTDNWWDINTLLETNDYFEIQTQEYFECGETWTIKKYQNEDSKAIFSFEHVDEDIGLGYSYIQYFHNVEELAEHIQDKLDEIAQSVIGYLLTNNELNIEMWEWYDYYGETVQVTDILDDNEVWIENKYGDVNTSVEKNELKLLK